MYYPYFRGKQYELIAIRELSELMANAGIVPIIEPVREALGGLEKTLDSIRNAGGKAIIVTNPQYGDFKVDNRDVVSLMNDKYRGDDGFRHGYLLQSRTRGMDAVEALVGNEEIAPAIIHAGFTEGKMLADAFSDELRDTFNIFVESHAKYLYQKHFEGSTRILVRDGFNRKKNADYPEIEQFSDLHAVFEDMHFDGYGDFLTVGDNFSEGGGPAYAVAIHLTYIDSARDNEMFIYHFISDSNDTPTDPAGKFAQALGKLIGRLDSGESGLFESSAIREFRDLHQRGHFPGLGYVKKLSIKHHVETIAAFHRNRVTAP